MKEDLEYDKARKDSIEIQAKQCNNKTQARKYIHTSYSKKIARETYNYHKSD